MPPAAPRVYRLRRLPSKLREPSQVAEYLAGQLHGLSSDDVAVYSLANEVDPWEPVPLKMATVMFRKLPDLITQHSQDCEWIIPVDGSRSTRPILDSHFEGITSLNDVVRAEHRFDCIAISGLASHPFGSWQPHGNDKTFMWIRDVLPTRLRDTRFILYGYNSQIVNSNSFQKIEHLSETLIQTLKAHGWTAPSAKPLIFLAHSLGGIVLKQALVELASNGERETFLLSLVRGVIFFGVPSTGMPLDNIRAVVQNQPNEGLLRDLSDKSDYLQILDQRFAGHAVLREIKAFWAYETRTTPTVVQDAQPGSLSRSGPSAILVNEMSATRGLIHSDRHWTIQINEDHSNMVKFRPGDNYLMIVISSLVEIRNQDITPGYVRLDPPSPVNTVDDDWHDSLDVGIPVARTGIDDSTPNQESHLDWDLQAILQSLHAPERDHRLEQIEPRAGHTLGWVFDDKSVGFSEWLQTGRGIFWISGKPGSGKSTLMKFIYNDPRTHQLLHHWRSTAHQICANFFFHHRGTVIQKSLEGLLRGIITQILDDTPQLLHTLVPVLDRVYRQRVDNRRLGDRRSNINRLFANFDQTCHQDEMEMLVKCHNLESSLLELLAKKGVGITQEIKDSVTRVNTADDERRGIRRSIESVEEGDTKWPKPILEAVLVQLLDQRVTHLDICLFIDAVDEYDGPPESIAALIQSIAQQPESSMTRIRICLSSRPWNAFLESFDSCPGFKIHEHTELDIREYCMEVIVKEEKCADALVTFAPQIMNRAQGVFLWVKLVLRDLQAVATRHVEDPGKMVALLKTTFDSLPDQLDQYYATIITRTSSASRWHTYVILETLARSDEVLTLDDLLAVLECSSATSFEQTRQRLGALRREGPQVLEQRLRTLSGDLIDIIDDNRFYHSRLTQGTSPAVQLMHQTMVEFVEEPGFARTVLGSQAKMTTENGHSFLSKYYFFTGKLDSLLGYHARQAENTTGKSQFHLLSRSPSPLFGVDSAATSKSIYYDPLNWAVRNGLLLYLRDAFQRNSIVYALTPVNLRESILGTIMEPDKPPSGLHMTMPDRLLVIRFLTEPGVVMDPRILDSCLSLANRADKFPPSASRVAYTAIVIMALHGYDQPNVELPSLRGRKTILDCCPKEVLKCILDRGINPNTLNAQGETPLDCCVFKASLQPWDLYARSRFLVRRGGKLRKASSRAWEAFLKRLSGFDLSVFNGFPKWHQRWRPQRLSMFLTKHADGQGITSSAPFENEE